MPDLLQRGPSIKEIARTHHYQHQHGPLLPSTNELASSLHRGPGSQRSSGSSDTDSRLGSSSPRSERFRRFTFSSRRIKKQLNRPEASSLDSPKDVAQVFKAIAYSSYQQPISNFSQTIDSRNSQRHEWEVGRQPRRHSDSSFKSTHTYTREQFQAHVVPPQELEQCHSSQSLKKSLFLHTSSDALTSNVEPAPPYEWCGEASSILAEKTPLGENRFGPTPRPLSSGSSTLGEVEHIRMEKRFPSGFLINPFRIKHNRSRSDQDEFESWEDAVDWWYEYGEDENM
ncbi:uncharacterized protein LAJ45_08163 [Morchella importuna]|uniref:uncharacterized protein n=1 Tax=Morchella importuna TaxID=1174673 RepID=UPI001E8E3664|nr:uncharacterized protein LAJ45_08163 [Morchella importuna]KAH8147698.1 hypothetical protein LAJ45_08163 [Morchella importuna]